MIELDAYGMPFHIPYTFPYPEPGGVYVSSPLLAPVRFDSPLVAPAANGLYSAITWTDEPGPLRFMDSGVQIRPWNYNGDISGGNTFGVWDEPWCTGPESGSDALKAGERPDMDPDPFLPLTVWAYDQCDLTRPSQAEVLARAQQILRLNEQTAVETSFGTRMLDDADTIASAGTLAEAVAYLEGELAKANIVGQIHAAADLASLMGTDLIISSGAGKRSMLGHAYVFGGGYITSLGTTLVATSTTYGWRDAVAVRSTVDQQNNVFAAVAERTVVVGYERVVAAVTYTATSS